MACAHARPAYATILLYNKPQTGPSAIIDF